MQDLGSYVVKSLGIDGLWNIILILVNHKQQYL